MRYSETLGPDFWGLSAEEIEKMKLEDIVFEPEMRRRVVIKLEGMWDHGWKSGYEAGYKEGYEVGLADQESDAGEKPDANAQ